MVAGLAVWLDSDIGDSPCDSLARCRTRRRSAPHRLLGFVALDCAFFASRPRTLAPSAARAQGKASISANRPANLVNL